MHLFTTSIISSVFMFVGVDESLPGALDQVKRMRSEGNVSRIVIHVEGEHRLPGSLDLSNMRNVAIEGRGDAKIIGSIRLQNWEQDGQNWKARIQPAVPSERYRYHWDHHVPVHPRLFVGGVPQREAVHPNTGWMGITGGADNKLTLTTTPPRTNPGEQIWAQAFTGYAWFDAHERVTSLSGPSVEVANNFPYGVKESVGRVRLFGSRNFVDSQGEYWVNPQGTEIIYRSDKAPQWAELSYIGQPLIKMDNTKHVEVRNIEIINGRADGIQIRNSESVTIDDVVLRGHGRHAIDAVGTDIKIRKVHIHDIGQIGVMLDGGNRQTLTAAGNRVEDSIIERYAQVLFCYRPGVHLKGVGNGVLNVTFRDAPHQAIQINGNDHVIMNSTFERVALETADVGAIYMGRNVTERGHLIAGNTFRNIKSTVPASESRFAAGVYLDDLASGIGIRDNIFEDIDTAVMIGGGSDIEITGNRIAQARVGVALDARGLSWAKDMLEPWGIERSVRDVQGDRGVYAERYPNLREQVQARQLANPRGIRIVQNEFIGVGEMIRYSDPTHTRPAVSATGNSSR